MKSATFSRIFLSLFLLSQSLHAQSTSRVELRSFSSNALGVTKNYRIYLPAGYDNSTERYPVVYFLRGHELELFDPTLHGRENGRTLKNVADDLIAAGQIGKMIIVCPNTGGNNSLEVHSCGVNMLRPDLRVIAGIGSGRFEDYLVQDLMPHIDATFRTIADREHRAIDGFSLGGYTSTMLSLRHPELFVSVGSYDGTIMWYNLDDPRRAGTGPDDPIWFEPYFDPVFDIPRNVPYMLQHSASNILRAAAADQLTKVNAIRFHLSMTFSDEVGNHSNNKQLISIMAEKGIKNSFSNPILAPNAVHNAGFADLHASISLLRHWQAFNGHRLNAPLAVDFGVVAPGEKDTTEVVLFNYSTSPVTISSAINSSGDFNVLNLPVLPKTLPGKYDALDFQVVFNASAHHAFTDTLIIANDDNANPKARIVLKGRGFQLGQAQAGIAYAASGVTSQLLFVERSTGTVTVVGSTGTAAVRGLAIHPVTKEIYATVPGNAITKLYRLSSQYGEGLATTTIYNDEISGIAFRADGVLFGASTSGRFYRINATTGEAILFGSSSAPLRSLSFSPATDKLYASDGVEDRIFTIDPNTSAVNLVGRTGFGVSTPGIAFGPDGVLYGITSANNFVRINTTNGTGTLIGATGFSDIFALAMRTDSPTVVDEQNETTIAKTYRLDQNYPNPFNPSTTFRYSLAQTSYVTLKVFNVSGQEVATLVDGKQSVGEHKIQWQAMGLPGGLYFYRLQVEDFVETRKMIFTK